MGSVDTGGSGVHLHLCVATVGSLVLLGAFATSASAAAPETPLTGPVTGLTASTATFHGVLDPNAAGEPVVEYDFFYAPRGAACNQAFLAPEAPGMAPGAKGEKVEQTVSGPPLEANTPYAVCLATRDSPPEEWTLGNQETFATPAVAPTVLSESAPEVHPTGARLEAVVNPNNQTTHCHFQYGEATATEHTVECEQGNALEFGEQGVSVNVTGLTQHTPYHWRVLLENATGPGEGPPQELTTITPEPPETTTAKAVGSSEATLSGVLNPHHEGEAGTYEFAYRQSAGECEREGKPENAIPAPAEAAPGTLRQPETATLTGLLPGTSYTYCLLAHTAEGEAAGPPRTFTTEPIAATVGEESVSGVGSSSATLHAQIDPGGTPTSYYFEYGPATSYGSRTPSQSAGAGATTVGVLANLAGLSPETTYHYRAVASNGKAPVPAAGADQSFSTFAVAPLGLPDGRAYELVSPLSDGDATPLPNVGGVRAAAGGNSVTYLGTSPPEEGNGAVVIEPGERPHGANVFLANRVANGWSATDIQPNALASPHYEGLSSDLSELTLGSSEPLIKGAPEGEALYARATDGSYRVLAADASYETATPDNMSILVKTAGGELEDAVAGHLYPVSVLPSNATPTGPVTLGGPAGPLQNANDLERVVSADGSRIFWSTLEPAVTEIENLGTVDFQRSTALYAREDASSPAAKTVQIDTTEGPGPSGDGRFWSASSDGSKVLFTDESQLTADSSAASGAPDLYEYDFNKPPGGRLRDLSAHTQNSGEHADVVGLLGTSDDASYVYFAAAGALAEGAPAAQCTQTFPGRHGTGGKCNLYVSHEGEPPKLIATLGTVDGAGGHAAAATVIAQVTGGSGEQIGDWVPDLGFRSAHLTPDGRELVFESSEDLTDFHAEGGREVYMYQFGSSVVCLSCNPTGSSTIHGEALGFAHAELPDSNSPAYALRDVSADGGRVFFETNETLVAQNTNEEAPTPAATVGLTNVYEWERNGEGACRRESGCVYLLTTGGSPDMSIFLDASESGDDVFVESRAQLVAQDHGETYEVYDAHVCSSGSPCPQQATAACTGAGCQGLPGAPPLFSTPASATTTAGGNFAAHAHPPSPPATSRPLTNRQKLAAALKQCRKNKQEPKRRACEKRAYRRYPVKRESRAAARATAHRRRAR